MERYVCHQWNTNSKKWNCTHAPVGVNIGMIKFKLHVMKFINTKYARIWFYGGGGGWYVFLQAHGDGKILQVIFPLIRPIVHKQWVLYKWFWEEVELGQRGLPTGEGGGLWTQQTTGVLPLLSFIRHHPPPNSYQWLITHAVLRTSPLRSPTTTSFTIGVSSTYIQRSPIFIPKGSDENMDEMKKEKSPFNIWCVIYCYNGI